MTVLRARRGATGSKKVTLRGGRRAIPFLLVRSGCDGRDLLFYARKRSGMHAYCMAAAFRRRATPAARKLAEQLEFRAQPAIKMIAAPVVALREIDQLAAHAGR